MIELKRFRQQLQSLTEAPAVTPPVSSYLIAYSGGLDSHVLLHLCQQLELPVRAVHVHHGLQTQADAWVQHCVDICAQYKIECTVLNVDASNSNGDSPEDAARKLRYAALGDEIKAGECLLTAHHADDQAETLLLQLMRGAGTAGLAAMPAVKDFAGSWHLRPLLSYCRDEIENYAATHQLRWVEDPSNRNTDFDRNLLRQNVLPILQQRWPAYAHSLSRSAELQQQSLELNQALAAIDLAAVSTQQRSVLSISALQKLTRTRQLNLLRYWLRACGGRSPTHNVLTQLTDALLPAQIDAHALIIWGELELRCYRQQLYLLPRYQQDFSEINMHWDGKHRIELAEHVAVRSEMACTPGLDTRIFQQQLSLRFRRSGERLQLPGKTHHQDLKQLMQEAGIPPWQRARIPLLYVDDELACVCGYWLAAPFLAPADKPGWLPVCEAITPA